MFFMEIIAQQKQRNISGAHFASLIKYIYQYEDEDEDVGERETEDNRNIRCNALCRQNVPVARWQLPRRATAEYIVIKTLCQ